MVETFIHTPDGKLVIDRGAVSRSTRLKDICLTEEEEKAVEENRLVKNFQLNIELGHNEVANQARIDRVHEYYKRLVKLNCVEVKPLYFKNGYLRARVRYPDGIERTWWAASYYSWSTNGASKGARRRVARH